MSFLKRLFGGGTGNNEPEMSSELIDEEVYWKIIEESLQKPGGQNGQRDFI